MWIYACLAYENVWYDAGLSIPDNGDCLVSMIVGISEINLCLLLPYCTLSRKLCSLHTGARF